MATPPDVISQLMLAVPLLVLFEGSLLFMRFSEKRAASVEENPAEPAGDAGQRPSTSGPGD